MKSTVEIHKQESHVSGSDLACLSNEANPEVILQHLIEEAHFGIRILGVVLHCDIIDTFCASTQPGWHPENLLTSTLPILFLLVFAEFLVNLDLRGSRGLMNETWLIQPKCLFLNELAIFLQEIFHYQILHDYVHVLNIVVVHLCQVISILLLSHLESLEIILARVVNQTGEVHCPEKN